MAPLVVLRNLLHPPPPNSSDSSSVEGLRLDVLKLIKEARAKRYDLLNDIRSILLQEGYKQGLKLPTMYHRTSLCKHAVTGSLVGLNKGKNKKTGQKKAFFSGLQTCGSVWNCPICGNRIQEVRRGEIAEAMDYFYSLGNRQAVMITFTFPHQADDKLKDLLDKFSKALSTFKSGKSFVKFKNRYDFEGLIRSLEITQSFKNGWHPHTHELFFVNNNIDELEFEEYIKNRWLNVCLKANLINAEDEKQINSFLKHSIDIKFNCRTSDYLAKFDDKSHWGVDREIAKASSKKGKKSGRHPFELAHLGEDELFIEYTNAIKGKSQIFWSKGLKEKVGLLNKKDEDIADEEKEELEVKLIGFLNKAEWSVVTAKELRAEILDMIEDDKDLEYIKIFIFLNDS